MTDIRHDQGRSGAILSLPGREPAQVTVEAELRDALQGLAQTGSGETVTLSRGSKNRVSATRRGELWSAVMRRGGWWTCAAFTAEMTTEHSTRQVSESRAAGSLRRRIASMIAAPSPEYALSTAQVETLLVEYFRDEGFSMPYSGA